MAHHNALGKMVMVAFGAARLTSSSITAAAKDHDHRATRQECGTAGQGHPASPHGTADHCADRQKPRRAQYREDDHEQVERVSQDE
jgi:hypothetical protein